MAVSNWATGQLQLFFEGSWGQVCAGLFDAADANVACRQLGFGAGTIVPQSLGDAAVDLQSTPVFPEVVLTGSGCRGTEARLLDCGPADNAVETYDSDFLRGCREAESAGLVLACVDDTISGMPIHACACHRFATPSCVPQSQD